MEKIISEPNSNTFKMHLSQILLKEASFEFDLPEFKLLDVSSDELLSSFESYKFLKWKKVHSYLLRLEIF